MKRVSTNSVLMLILLVVIFAGNYFYKPIQDNNPVHFSDCDLISEKCKVVLGDLELEVYLEGEVIALKKFQIHIVDKNSLVQRGTVSFNMKAMEMAVNQHRLEKVNDISWKAEVVIPVCTTGRRDWVVMLEVFQNATKRTVSFEIKI